MKKENEDGTPGFLDTQFSIVGEGEKSCQGFESVNFIDGHTQHRFVLVEFALQGIHSLNIISHPVTEPSIFHVVVLPRIYVNHHNFMIGHLFKNIITSRVTSFSLLDILLGRFPSCSLDTEYASTIPWR